MSFLQAQLCDLLLCIYLIPLRAVRLNSVVEALDIDPVEEIIIQGGWVGRQSRVALVTSKIERVVILRLNLHFEDIYLDERFSLILNFIYRETFFNFFESG